MLLLWHLYWLVYSIQFCSDCISTWNTWQAYQMLFRWSCQAVVFQVDLSLSVWFHVIWLLSLGYEKERTLTRFVLSSNSSSKFRTSNGFIGLPNYVSRGSGCQRGGQHCFVEVTLGCHRSGGNGQPHSISNSNRNLPKNHVSESPALGRADQKGAVDNVAVYEKTFLYPPEAVFVPVLQTSFPRSSLKRYM